MIKVVNQWHCKLPVERKHAVPENRVLAFILLYFKERDNRWILKQGFLPGKAPAEACWKGAAGEEGYGGRATSEGGLHAYTSNRLAR
jgi:hypothetical protein